MHEEPSDQPLRVVIVGGGIAALETVLALRDLAGTRTHVTLVAPEPDFVLRPLAVATPFGRGRVDRLPLAQLMAEHGGRFVRSAVGRVDAVARKLTLVTGAELGYDVLVLAQGATEVAALNHALTFGEDPLAFSGILADLEAGYGGRVAFVVPDGNSWSLPLYELALMTAEEAWAMNMDRVELHLVTPEPEPFALFGAEASAAVGALLADARIAVHVGVHPRVTEGGDVALGGGRVLAVDRVVALPVLRGRRLEGIPADADGFVPVDDTGRVSGLEAVYAVGDVTDRPVKQGGLACQQADVVAAHLAVLAGADVTPPRLTQVLRGRLLTGGRDRFLRRGGDDAAGKASSEALWWPPAKVSGRYLSPYLAAKDLVHLPARLGPPVSGIDVEVAIDPPRRVPGGVGVAGPADPIVPHAGLRA